MFKCLNNLYDISYVMYIILILIYKYAKISVLFMLIFILYDTTVMSLSIIYLFSGRVYRCYNVDGNIINNY